MKIGARTIKTGLAVTLTILLVNILEIRIDNVDNIVAAMAAITAIIGMQPSIKGSLETFKNRVIATLIGSLVALALALTIGFNAFYLGLGSIVIILICLKLEQNESISFALITLVAIGVYNNDFSIMLVIYRVSGLLIGLTVSTGLNILFLPPDYTEDLKHKINDLQIKFEHLYEKIINDLLREEKVETQIIKDERQIIRDELDNAREIYALLNEDILSKDKEMLKKYLRSINAIQSNLETLTTIHRGIVYMPHGPQYSELGQELYEYLKYLLNLHRQIYTYISLDKDYQYVEENIDAEELRKKIVRLIKLDSSEEVFEYYNVYFEAMRINEKLEKLKNDFGLEC